MCRDEVLVNIQAFAKVRNDRCFDNGTIRLGHQTTHTGQLTNLCSRTTSARIGHHENRIERFLIDSLALGVDDLLGAETGHHRFCHLIIGRRPDINDLVIAFAVGHKAFRVLFLNFSYFRFSGPYKHFFVVRNNHITDTDGNTGERRIAESEIHQLVGKDDRLFQTQAAIAKVDELGNILFRQVEINIGEFNTFRQDLRHDCPTDCGLHTTWLQCPATVLGQHGVDDANGDARMQIGNLVFISTVTFFNITKHHTLTLGVYTSSSHVIQAENDILRRYDDRLTVCR